MLIFAECCLLLLCATVVIAAPRALVGLVFLLVSLPGSGLKDSVVGLKLHCPSGRGKGGGCHMTPPLI
jgi:hypothetical protein